MEFLYWFFDCRDGGSVVDIESVESNASDVRAQLIKIKEAKPDVIFAIVYPVEGINILKQSSELNLGTQIVSTSAIQTNDLYSSSAGFSDGLMFSTIRYSPDLNEGAVKGFTQNYFSKYGENPTPYGAITYDALNMYLQILKDCATPDNVECVKNSLYSVRNFSGITGPIGIDRNGDASIALQIFQIKKGILEFYQ